MSEIVYCPKCPPYVSPKTHKLYPKSLDLIESNYSGCGVDIMECPTCNTRFQISYKVDIILDIKADRSYIPMEQK